LKAKSDANGEFRSPISRGGHDYIELWITLARRQWGSLVIVPADPKGSTTEIANALADIGQRLSYGPVTAITVSALEPGSALALADLQEHLERERRNWGRMAAPVSTETQPARAGAGDARPAPAAPEEGNAASEPKPPEGNAAPEGRAAPSEAVSSGPAAAASGPQPNDRPASPGGQTQALAVIPPARIIISIPPVVTEPLGLAAVEKADAVVLAIRMNRSRMDDVSRTIRLVGRDRIAGCFLVR
jgi:hypothetical protein